ncbi:MAG: ATPase, T2SS/T4P/T4SS family, partial [Pseudomonadota bacterium]
MFSRYQRAGTRPAGTGPNPAHGPAANENTAHLAHTAAAHDAKPGNQKDHRRREKLADVKVKLHHAILDKLNLAAIEQVSESDLRTEIAAITAETLGELQVVLTRNERQSINQDLFDEVMGLGPLEPLLKDETVTDILVNGPDNVFVERDGRLTLSETRFKDDKHLARIIDKIVSAVGRRVDESNPYV